MKQLIMYIQICSGIDIKVISMVQVARPNATRVRGHVYVTAIHDNEMDGVTQMLWNHN